MYRGISGRTNDRPNPLGLLIHNTDHSNNTRHETIYFRLFFVVYGGSYLLNLLRKRLKRKARKSRRGQCNKRQSIRIRFQFS